MKTILISLFLLTISIQLSGQIEIGISSGVAIFSTMDNFSPSTYDTFDESPRLGLFTSVAFKSRIKKKLLLQAEINYIQKGVKTNGTTQLGIEYSNSTRYHYIDIPLLIKYSSPLIKEKIWFEVGTGLSFGKGIGKYKVVNINENTGEKTIIKKDYVPKGTNIENPFRVSLDLNAIVDFSFNYKLQENLSITIGLKGYYDFITPYLYSKEDVELLGYSSTEINLGGIISTGVFYTF